MYSLQVPSKAPDQVLVLFTQITDFFSPDLYANYCCTLPVSIQTRINSCFKLQDKVTGILGKYLLLCGLKKLGFSETYIESLEYKKNNRPYLGLLPYLDFNISHSGSLVVCALSISVRLGIDVEKEKPVNILNLKEQFSPGQWEEIENAPDPVRLFYQYWAQKESVVKAVDSDCLIPFSEIEVQSNRATTNNMVWYLTNLNIDPSYSSWLATNRLVDIVIQQVHL